MKFLFWLGVALLGWIEFGYAIFLRLLAAGRRRAGPEWGGLPAVTLVIAAHNEEQVIAKRLENALALDYPRDKMQILVVSDGSEDATNAIVSSFAPQGIELCAQGERRGKVPALRAAEGHIRHEIVVFSDADSFYQPDAIQNLARHFADPKVGAVSGHEKRVPSQATGKGRGEGLYSRYDNFIKALEGEVGSQVMVNGGIFAVRRALLPHVPDHLTHDGVLPPTLVLAGHRVAYAPDAVSVETYALTSEQDTRRRIRTVQQAFQSYLFVKDALNPFKTGLFALQLWSHRILRWFVYPLMLLLLALNLLLALRSKLYRALAGAHLLFWGLAFAGRLFDRQGRRPALLYFPFYFVYIHAAAWTAVWRSLTGAKVATWQPTARETARDPADGQAGQS